jgi:hypothetical protein
MIDWCPDSGSNPESAIRNKSTIANPQWTSRNRQSPLDNPQSVQLVHAQHFAGELSLERVRRGDHPTRVRAPRQ